MVVVSQRLTSRTGPERPGVGGLDRAWDPSEAPDADSRARSGRQGPACRRGHQLLGPFAVISTAATPVVHK